MCGLLESEAPDLYLVPHGEVLFREVDVELMSLLAFHEDCGVDDLLDLSIGDAAGDLAYDAKG